jgi:hypothetical protein
MKFQASDFLGYPGNDFGSPWRSWPSTVGCHKLSSKNDHDRSLFSRSLGIMVYLRGKSSPMAEDFRLVKYDHLRRYMSQASLYSFSVPVLPAGWWFGIF